MGWAPRDLRLGCCWQEGLLQGRVWEADARLGAGPVTPLHPQQDGPSAAGHTRTEWVAWPGSGEATAASWQEETGGPGGAGRFVTTYGRPVPSFPQAARRQRSCTRSL